MTLPGPSALGLGLFLSELALWLGRRSSAASARSADRSSLALFWGTILLAISAGVWLARSQSRWSFELSTSGHLAALVMFAVGLGIRWWAILTLGRYFTVDVAIHAEHQLVRTGPYRFVRHPSYTGLVLLFLALAVTFRNWASLIVILAPILAALLYRIRVEEAALSAAFGPAYAEYRRSTKALFPWLL
jgi:protein-S-isoprenylcysteine O-methyltransferase